MKLVGEFNSLLNITEEQIVIWKVGEGKKIQNEAWGNKREENTERGCVRLLLPHNKLP